MATRFNPPTGLESGPGYTRKLHFLLNRTTSLVCRFFVALPADIWLILIVLCVEVRP